MGLASVPSRHHPCRHHLHDKDNIRPQSAAVRTASLDPDKLVRSPDMTDRRQPARPYASPEDASVQAALDPTTRPSRSGAPIHPTASRDLLDQAANLASLHGTQHSPHVQPTDNRAPSSSNSQDTNVSYEPDRVFTPPVSEGGTSASQANGQESSQESQLLQFSHVAAAQDKMPNDSTPTEALSRKRMADGMVKHSRTRSSTSPVFSHGGHSRNTSVVSIASTTGSTIGDLSADLKARLSYAMLKVNHGWQAHNIDQVESLASQAASPTSSTSTLYGRHGSSASPHLTGTSPRIYSQARSGPSSGQQYQPSVTSNATSPPSAPTRLPALAPPVSIEPSRPMAHPRRNSNPRYTPSFLSHHPSPATAPHTPGQPSPMQSTPYQRPMRTPLADPILFSPHQNVREQDAIESLIFMSSPNNSANLKRNYQPAHSSRNGVPVTASPRTALPSGPQRKSLPSGRPQQHSKRVEFEKSPGTFSEMDVDEVTGTPKSVYAGTPRRRPNGAVVQPWRAPLPMPSGMSMLSRPRPKLGEKDIDKMLDRAVEGDSSDSDDEIQIPVSRRRTEVPG